MMKGTGVAAHEPGNEQQASTKERAKTKDQTLH